MFDFGWQEFLVIAFVLVLVVGPKDLPKVLRTVTQYLKNMRQMAGEFHRGLEKMADEADLKDVKKSFNDLNNNNINSTIQEHLDPSNEVSKALNQAKQSADLANEANKVEETFKSVAEDSLEKVNEDKEIIKDNNKSEKKPDEEKISSANT